MVNFSCGRRNSRLLCTWWSEQLCSWSSWIILWRLWKMLHVWYVGEISHCKDDGELEHWCCDLLCMSKVASSMDYMVCIYMTACWIVYVPIIISGCEGHWANGCPRSAEGTANLLVQEDPVPGIGGKYYGGYGECSKCGMCKKIFFYNFPVLGL